MAASSFTSVSLNPPLVSLAIAHTSTTWPRLTAAPALGVSILAEEHGTVAQSLSSKTGDRFSGVRWQAAESGAVFVHGAALWLESRVEGQVPAGDHDIVLLRVVSVEPYPDVAPLVFHGSTFRRLSIDTGSAAWFPYRAGKSAGPPQ